MLELFMRNINPINAQYAALAAAQGMYGSQVATAGTSLNGLDASQAGKFTRISPSREKGCI